MHVCACVCRSVYARTRMCEIVYVCSYLFMCSYADVFVNVCTRFFFFFV